MDDPSLSLYLGPALIVTLLTFSAFFSSAETAIFSLTKVTIQRLREAESSRSSRAILAFVENPRRLLITSLLGNTFVNIAFATIVTSMVWQFGTHLFGWSDATSLVVATVSSTFVLLLFGEIAPKTYAIQNSERVSRWIAPPLWFISVVLAPIRAVMRFIVDGVIRLIGGAPVGESSVTQEEIREVVVSGEAGGVIESHERKLIDRIFELRESQAKDVMVPRMEMICVESVKTLRDALLVARSVGHSRIPIYEGNVDNIIGVLNVKDVPATYADPAIKDRSLTEIIASESTGNSVETETLIRSPLVLPETRRLDSLLRDFSDEGAQMAILIDEYGGTAGLVTLEDIVEEIVGEIMDEYDELIEPELVEEWTPELMRTQGVRARLV